MNVAETKTKILKCVPSEGKPNPEIWISAPATKWRRIEDSNENVRLGDVQALARSHDALLSACKTMLSKHQEHVSIEEEDAERFVAIIAEAEK